MGNGPTFTSPAFATDEQVAILARRDFVLLCPEWQSMAKGTDGAFADGAPWVLTSDSADFQAQGVGPQNIVVLSGPKGIYRGDGLLYAVESVSGNAATLRVVGMPVGVGQPPAPTSGLTGVSFEMPTLQPQIDEATYAIKRRFAIDENIFFRSSDWAYQGAEDDYRTFREACCWATLADAYAMETRDESNAGDFARKAKLAAARRDAAIERIQVRWGPLGNSSPPTDIFAARICR